MIARRFGFGKALVLAGIFLFPTASLRSAGLPESYLIKDRGQTRTFVIATDELQLKGAGEPEKISAAPDISSLVNRAAAFSRAKGKEARMVLYPIGASRTRFTRRILTRDVLVRIESSTDLQRLAEEN